MFIHLRQIQHCSVCYCYTPQQIVPTPDSCPEKNDNICFEFKMTHDSQYSAQPGIHLIKLESHNYWEAISVQKLDSRLRKMNYCGTNTRWIQNSVKTKQRLSLKRKLINIQIKFQLGRELSSVKDKALTVHAFGGNTRWRRMSGCRCQNWVQRLSTQTSQMFCTEVSCTEPYHGLAQGGTDLQHGWRSVRITRGRRKERSGKVKLFSLNKNKEYCEWN